MRKEFRGGVFDVVCRDKNGKVLWREKGHNLTTTEGLNYMNDVIFGSTGKSAGYGLYVGLFKNNVTISAADTAAVCLGAAGTYGELQDPADFNDAKVLGGASVAEGTKPPYEPAASASKVVTNSASPVVFTFAAETTFYGAFLSTTASCSDPSGAKLIAAKKFAASKTIESGSTVTISYQETGNQV